MALVITYVSEPHAGRRVEIGDEKDVVTFGRDVGADIGFPAELDSVSRDHFRLRRELGIYKFVISREKPVYSRGRPLIDGEELDKVIEIQLAGTGGPRLKIERLDGAAGNLPKTRVLGRGQDIGDIAHAQRSGGRHLAAGLGVVAALVAIVAGGVYFLREDVKATQASLTEIKTDLPSIKEGVAAATKAAAARLDSAALVEKAHDSIYYVQFRMSDGTRVAGGTASVILLPDGTKALATNSHVAQEFDEVKPGGSMEGAELIVVQPKAPDYRVHKATGIKKHPAFDEFVKWSTRISADSYVLLSRDDVPVWLYDVALIYVEDPENLAEPLTYASRETVYGLRQGEAVLEIGYPSEGLIGTDLQKPEPTSQIGIITSLTTAYFFSSNAKDNLLVQHSVPGAGGSSGSPMFNAKGEVIAFESAGNMVAVRTEDGARVPSPAMVSYAQRADMMLDLADGTADKNIAAYLQDMADAEKRMSRTPEEAIADIKAALGHDFGNPGGVTEMARLDLTLDQAWNETPTARLAAVEAAVPDPVVYTAIAVSADGRPIQVCTVAQGKFLDCGADFARLSFVLLSNAEAKLTTVTLAVLDTDSLAAAPLTPGKVTLVILRVEPKAGAGG